MDINKEINTKTTTTNSSSKHPQLLDVDAVLKLFAQMAHAYVSKKKSKKNEGSVAPSTH